MCASLAVKSTPFAIKKLMRHNVYTSLLMLAFEGLGSLPERLEAQVLETMYKLISRYMQAPLSLRSKLKPTPKIDVLVQVAL